MPRIGTHGVPRLADGDKLSKKSFTSDQEVRWCPGCGDYAILAAFQSFLPELQIRRENIAIVSGIGCSSRFPYYVESYGMHSIHGRAPAIATGLATARPDLSVWVVTGDGDALSIGGNHLIHALRRNVNMTILLFNNRIYGLTKGQYSPTSPAGLVTKSSPAGAVDTPFNPIAVALGAGGTFVARTMASDKAHLTNVLRAAAAHRGTSFVEIYQNCPIFHDGAFDLLRDATQAEARILRLTHGAPLRTGDRVVVTDGRGGLQLLPQEHVTEGDGVTLDIHSPDASQAFALAALDSPDMACVPMGIFRSVDRPAYDDLVRDQISFAQEDAGGPPSDQDLETLFAGKDPWFVA
ncbi:2-oxoacid:ferredoxin oxidoreductase subunit beta [Austwickia sp. TVS 96-490-7B]|uniref:2-oxoacid:ferredoxin oxidoreductase subunit beta n=1 Tax=Austwickia sp. TVS 96-490-7B TaxID=2830843 RepID=UPI001C59BBD5|nr:2-oxoacid:ferredoxin oxidoreductase subunit beta [Austwickia sp. TVS 96-490-7B]